MAERRTRRRFTREYKAQAVQHLMESGRPLADIAAELDVSPGQLSQWRNEQLAAGSAEALAQKKTDEAEMLRLRREVKRLDFPVPGNPVAGGRVDAGGFAGEPFDGCLSAAGCGFPDQQMQAARVDGIGRRPGLLVLIETAADGGEIGGDAVACAHGLSSLPASSRLHRSGLRQRRQLGPAEQYGGSTCWLPDSRAQTVKLVPSEPPQFLW
jgi:transposase